MSDFTQRLPLELSQEIFSFVQSEEDISVILPLRRVSKSWKDFLARKISWRMTINQGHSFTRKRLQWLSRGIFSCWHTLISDCFLPNNSAAIAPLANCLKRISLTESRLLVNYSPVLTALTSVTILKHAAESLPALCGLSFLKDLHLTTFGVGYGFRAEHSGVGFPMHLLSALLTLRSLEVTSSPFLTEDSLRQLNALTNLNSLSLNSTAPTQPNLNGLQLTTLQSFAFNGYISRGVETDVAFASETLVRMRNLKSLSVGVISSSSSCPIYQKIGELTQLEKLHLSAVSSAAAQRDDTAAEILSSAFRSLKSLREFRFASSAADFPLFAKSLHRLFGNTEHPNEKAILSSQCLLSIELSGDSANLLPDLSKFPNLVELTLWSVLWQTDIYWLLPRSLRILRIKTKPSDKDQQYWLADLARTKPSLAVIYH